MHSADPVAHASNVVRHAGANRVIVRLLDTGGELELAVEDDGRGFVLRQLACASAS